MLEGVTCCQIALQVDSFYFDVLYSLDFLFVYFFFLILRFFDTVWGEWTRTRRRDRPLFSCQSFSAFQLCLIEEVIVVHLNWMSFCFLFFIHPSSFKFEIQFVCFSKYRSHFCDLRTLCWHRTEILKSNFPPGQWVLGFGQAGLFWLSYVDENMH